MFESARKHGPFDNRYPVRQKLPAPSWDLPLNGEGGESLEWAAFLTRFFPNRRRHDFAALATFGAYRTAVEGAARQRPATQRVLPERRDGGSRNRPAIAPASARVPVAASSAAVVAWESEGGASAERPAGI